MRRPTLTLGRAVHLADRFRPTIYVAAYLELAQRRALPLASIDRDLRAAARALGAGGAGTLGRSGAIAADRL